MIGTSGFPPVRVLLWCMQHQRAPTARRLTELAGVELIDAPDEEAAVRSLATADALIIPNNHYTPRLAQGVLASPSLKLIQLLSAGYDRLASQAPPRRMIVASVGDALAPAVADHALLLTLALLRRLPTAAADQAAQRWDRAAFAKIRSLHGMQAAVVGFGAIGKAIGARLRACGVNVTGISRNGGAGSSSDAMRPMAELDDAIAESDLVILALPLTPETTGLINRRRFDLFRRDALLINIARGAVIDTDALIDALREGKLGGAGLDVTDPEPPPPGHPIWSAPNLLITPHVGGVGGQDSVAETAAWNIERLRDGLPLRAVLDLDAQR